VVFRVVFFFFLNYFCDIKKEANNQSNINKRRMAQDG